MYGWLRSLTTAAEPAPVIITHTHMQPPRPVRGVTYCSYLWPYLSSAPLLQAVCGSIRCIKNEHCLARSYHIGYLLFSPRSNLM